jgi:hypothetical protein
MGVLSQLVVARVDEVAALLAANRSHASKWGMVDVTGLDTIMLGTLSHILAGKSLDDSDAIANFIAEPIAQGGEDGPWVYEIPQSLQDALVNFPNEREEKILEKWAQTEEL